MKSETSQSARLQQMLAAAQHARQSGMNDQAERLYRDALKMAPKALEVQFQLAVLLATTGRSKEAIAYFRALVKANPAHAPSHANLANALKDADEWQEAVSEYQRAIALDPKMGRAYWALGATLRKLARSEEAIACYKKALELDNANIEALNGLGLAYRDIKDFPRALECLDRVVALAPQNAEYRVNFGETLRQADLFQSAVEQFYQAVAIKPDFVEAVVKLGGALQQQRRFDEAKECFDRALQLKPGDPEIQEYVGLLYLEMGDTARSLAAFQSILARCPDRAAALLGVGRSLLEAGNEEAVAVLEKLVTEHPEFSDGYFYLASSHKFKPDDKIIPQLHIQAERSKGDDAKFLELNWALGKIYDDCKQWDRAFHHYAISNRLRNKEYDYRPEEEEAQIDALISVFNREFFEAYRDCGVQSDLPVMIIGMPRSGTTLTEQIVSSHPQVMGAGEVVFWAMTSTAVPATLEVRKPYPECMTKISAAKAKYIAEEYLKLLRKIAGPAVQPARITDKMPHNFMQLGLIALLFPNASIIHCKRDAMDNCLSIFFQNFRGEHHYAYDMQNLGHHYRQYARLMAHWHEVLPGRIFDLNYEDTIADPEYWSRKLIAHVGLDWDDACLAPHKLERSVKTASHWQVRQPIYKTSVQRWKNYEQWLGPLKEALGYKG